MRVSHHWEGTYAIHRYNMAVAGHCPAAIDQPLVCKVWLARVWKTKTHSEGVSEQATETQVGFCWVLRFSFRGAFWVWVTWLSKFAGSTMTRISSHNVWCHHHLCAIIHEDFS